MKEQAKLTSIKAPLIESQLCSKPLLQEFLSCEGSVLNG